MRSVGLCCNYELTEVEGDADRWALLSPWIEGDAER